MSDEPTKDIAEKYDTKPTIETVLEMMTSLREEIRAGFAQFDIRLDRIESEVKKIHSEFYDLRADFKELKSELKVHEPR